MYMYIYRERERGTTIGRYRLQSVPYNDGCAQLDKCAESLHLHSENMGKPYVQYVSFVLLNSYAIMILHLFMFTEPLACTGRYDEAMRL